MEGTARGRRPGTHRSAMSPTLHFRRAWRSRPAKVCEDSTEKFLMFSSRLANLSL